MAYDPKRPRPAAPSDDEPAPVDALIDLGEPAPEPEAATTDDGDAADLGGAEGSVAAHTASGQQARESHEPSAAGSRGSKPTPSAVLFATIAAAVVALVAIILLRRRRNRG